MTPRAIRASLPTLLCASLAALAGCTGSTVDTTVDRPVLPAADASYSYSGPGSYWETDFDAATKSFAIRMAENPGDPVTLTVDGTYENVNGFKVLTVGAAQGEGAPAAGERAIGVELPGYAFLLMPLDPAHDGLIPMLVTGGCPTSDQSLNWLVAQGYAGKDASDAEREFFGTYAYRIDDGSAHLPARYSLEGLHELDEQPQALLPGPCDGSVMTILHPEYQVPIADMWMTQGGAMVRTYDGDSNQTILALPGAEVDGATLAGEYAGFHFTSAAVDGGANQTTDSFAVTMTIDESGDGTGAAYADVETGELRPETVSISLPDVNTPSAGWVTGRIKGPDGSGTLACAAASGIGASGQNILFCIGQNPGDSSQAFTLMLASK